ncbi:MAG: FAD:protein FMN transferase [Lysobacter sp.]|nr:FAD:protein FMN transferase [Lysobacter sp.]
MRVERARPLLGTVVAVRAEGPRACIEGAVARAFEAIADVQRAMSFHDPDSELSRLNRHAADEAQVVGVRTWRVLRAALALARASAGRFDPTVGGRLVAWRQLPAPAPADIDPAADWRDVELGRGRRVRYRRPLWLDLGGIAKGYAVDRAVAALRAAGACTGVVNAGGDLRAFGDALDVVHVREPSDPARARPLLHLREGAVATSAGYFSEREGISALVDTRGGGSLGHGISVTVCAPRALWADALTKVVLADPDAAAPLLRRLHAQAAVLDAAGGLRRLAA